MPSLVKWSRVPVFRSSCAALALLIFIVTACGSEPAAPADPPGALVQLRRADNADSLPGTLTIFSSGDLQLYIGDRGALRKQVPAADLSDLQTALSDPGLSIVADTYPATLRAGAGDTLTVYGAHRRSIRYDPRSPDLPSALQRVVSEVMKLRARF